MVPEINLGQMSREVERCAADACAGDQLKVCGADTLSGQRVMIDADLVVLATAVVPGTEPRSKALPRWSHNPPTADRSPTIPALRPIVQKQGKGVFELAQGVSREAADRFGGETFAAYADD